MRSKYLAAGIAAFFTLLAGAAVAETQCEALAEAAHPPHRHWHFQGPFGTYDRAAAQRGFQVYKVKCSACHSLNMLSYRNLGDLGLTEAQVKGIAAEIQVPDIGDDGSAIERPGRPSDAFKKPYPNETAAAFVNKKAPPDLSVIVKAREAGPDYVHALMTGYVPLDKVTPEQVKCLDVTKDDNFNTYFPGHKIAMPAPMVEGMVDYADGTKATVEQMASDVVEFLAWASEPHLEDRNRTGIRVILFLLALAGFMYAVKRQVWADKH